MSIDALDPIPELDAEAVMLCAALWSRDTTQTTDLASLVEVDDFERPAHALIYKTWKQQVTAGRPHDAASIAAQLVDAGTDAAPRSVHTALRAITTLGVAPQSLGEYAANVVIAAYRRSYQRVAESLADAASSAPTADLFPIMVEHGRGQRRAAARLDAVRRHIGDTANTQETDT